MNDETKVVLLKGMLEDDDTPTDILFAYLNMAGDAILNRLHQFQDDYANIPVPDKYSMKQIKIACYLLNKRGAEGEVQHIENGIHRNYGNADIPEQMLADVIPFCRAIR